MGTIPAGIFSAAARRENISTVSPIAASLRPEGAENFPVHGDAKFIDYGPAALPGNDAGLYDPAVDSVQNSALSETRIR
jgi:hypothetical protein